MAEIDTIQGGPFDSNIYLVRVGHTAVLIDAGTGFYNQGVLRDIRAILGEDNLDGILLTHEHIDHSGGARGVREEFGCDVFASSETSEIMGRADRDLTGCSLFGVDLEPLEDIKKLGGNFQKGDLNLEIKRAPGHAIGQVCFIETEGKALFPGDLLFCDGGVGRWDLPGGEFIKHRESIKRSLDWDVSSLHPGHGRSEWDDPKRQMKLAYSMVRDL